MDRSSILVKLGRIIQNLPLSILRVLEYPFFYLKRSDKKKNKEFVIILLALPRSGSTLTYQVLCHGLRLRYLSNLGNLFYQLPLLGGLLSSWKCRNHLSNFSSQHGFVSGLCGPAEGLRYWDYWLNNGIDERHATKINQKKLCFRKKYLKKVFAFLGHINHPLATGYLGHTLNWKELREIFPNALFIRLHRDPVSNALSLLKARKIKDNWFSVFPIECQQHTHETPHEQVAAQVYWLNKRLSDLEKDHQTLHISYELLCNSPTKELNKIQSFCSEHEYDVSFQNTLPDSFPMRKSNDTNDAILIKQALQRLEDNYGALK